MTHINAPSVMTLMAQHQPGRDRSPQVLPQHPQHRHRPLFVRVPHTRSAVLRQRAEPHPAAERALLHHTDQLTDSQPINSHPFKVSSRADNPPVSTTPVSRAVSNHQGLRV